MTLDTVIMLAGAAVAALPFLGFPQRWDSVLMFLLGVLVVGLGIAVRRRGIRAAHPILKKTDAFVESNAHHDAHVADDQA